MFDFLADLCNSFAEGSQNAEALGSGDFNFDLMNFDPTNLGTADFVQMDDGNWDQSAHHGGVDDSAESSESSNPLQAMWNGQRRQRQNASRQMADRERQIVHQAMQHPHVQMMYQQHLIQGGCLSFPAFAYQYAQYVLQEQQNQARQRAAGQAWQRALTPQVAAACHQPSQFVSPPQPFGQVAQGQSHWIDPQTGCRYVLPQHAQPGMVYQDPQSGHQFSMDIRGQYHLWENGWWRPMLPHRNAAA